MKYMNPNNVLLGIYMQEKNLGLLSRNLTRLNILAIYVLLYNFQI